MRKTIYSPEARLLSELLREIRVASDLTQNELAQRVKMEHNDVSKMELGQRRVGYVELRHLLHALDVDVCSFDRMFDARLSMLGTRKRKVRST